MRLLVTGGAGFIGSNYVRRFVAQDYGFDGVTVLDSLTYAGSLDNISDLIQSGRIEFIQGDTRDKQTVMSAMNQVSAVINFAAESHVDRSINSSRNFMETNIIGTQNLLDCARQKGVARFIQISTDEVYGSVEVGESHEDSPLLPNSPYAASKAAADLVCRAFIKTYGMDIRITRCVNNYGPYQNPEKFLPLMITNLLMGKSIPIYGDGMNVREWIHVDDHCDAITNVLENGKSGDVYNIGSGIRISNVDLVNKVIRIMQLQESRIEFVKDRPSHDFRYALNSEKSKRELGFTVGVSIDKGIEDLISWYTDNKTWWKGKIVNE
jgi:dTDP-glucose 4,6-dehydratase